MHFPNGIDRILTAGKHVAMLACSIVVFAIPLQAQFKNVTIGSLVELSAFDLERGYPVEVQGTIYFCTGSLDDYYCYLKDATGGAYLKNPPPAIEPGQQIKLKGIAEQGWEKPHIATISNLEVVGRGNISRPIATVAQVRSLSSAEASKGHLVRLQGVITYCSQPETRNTYCFLQDETDGIFFLHPGAMPQAGDYVSIVGVTQEGWYAPTVGPGVHLTILGKRRLPNPSTASDFLVLTGKEDAKWAEIEGLVHRVSIVNNREHNGLFFTLATSDNKKVDVQVNAINHPDRLQGALVRIRGVAGGRFNNNRQLTDILFRLPSTEQIEIIQHGFNDPFEEIPVRPASEILAFNLDPLDGRMVHIAGKVTLKHKSGYVVLQDSSGTALVQTRAQISVGDSLQIAGFPGMGTLTPSLEAIEVRKLESGGSFPSPKKLDVHNLNDPRLNATLVALRAKLLDWHVINEDSYFVFEADGIRFEARLDSAFVDLPLRKGSVLDITGVIQLMFNPLYDGAPRVQPFLMNLRSIDDLSIIDKGPWWSSSHTRWLLGSLVFVIGLILLWTAMLRRQLVRQTRMIKQQLKQVQVLKDNAVKSNQMKSAFLAAMSHEIRTPLNGVIGFTSLLEDTTLNDDQENFVSTIKMSGNALLNIINDILDFSKIEAGKLDLDSQPFPLYQCLEEAIDIVSIHARDRQNTISYRIDAEVPEAISSDITRLRQILINLLNNAIKFTERGEVHVDVVPGASGSLLFSVRDTGIGIPEEKLPHIFDTFNQGGRTTARQFGGTGLGLAICKRLVQLLGGSIEVHSRAGEGAEFIFSIATEPAILPLEVTDGEIPELKGKYISFFSSNDQIRSFVRTECERWGCQVIEYEANSRRVTDAADVILIDYDARAGGEEMAIADAREENIPVILMSMCTRRSFPEPFASLPIISKPLKRKLLYDTLIQTLRLSIATPPDGSPHTVSDDLRKELDIVLFDRNSLNLKINTRLFQRLGYEVKAIDSVANVKKTLSASSPDLLFVDIDTPDGVETSLIVEFISTEDDSNRISIVALSSDDSEEIRLSCAEAGAFAFMKQPVSVKELVRVIQNAGPAPSGHQEGSFENIR